jgi:hypothetical protein
LCCCTSSYGSKYWSVLSHKTVLLHLCDCSSWDLKACFLIKLTYFMT